MALAVGVEAAREAIGAALDAVDAAHKVLRETSSGMVGSDFRVDVAERLETQARTNRGLMYRFFGELADPPDDVGPTGGLRKTLWERLRITPGEITRRCRLAARIRARRSLTGALIEPELPELAGAVEDGALGEDHIRAVCQAVDGLSARVSPVDVANTERSLVAHARELDAGLVVRLGQCIADDLNPDGLFSDLDRARRRGLVLGRQGTDGMSRLSGLLDPQARCYFEAVMAAVRPGRHQPDQPDQPGRPDQDGQPDHPGQPNPPDSPDRAGRPGWDSRDPQAGDRRTPAQRCHDAASLAWKTAIASGGLGTHRGHPVTVVVTTTLAELDHAAQVAGDATAPMPAAALTGGGSRLPMRDLISMAADAIHYLAVFDGHLERPLYLGRQKRIATADQRLICYARDRGCTRPNCLQPGYHCEVHHAHEWAKGGRTNADELHFACGPDHADASDGEWQTVVTDTGRLGWTNGTGPPKINHAHHPEELLRGDPDPPVDNDG